MPTGISSVVRKANRLAVIAATPSHSRRAEGGRAPWAAAPPPVVSPVVVFVFTPGVSPRPDQ
ncbi:hypothetical protein ACFQY7_48450 [Actinomadura luteofluorescens]|uniref:hypothetical protein n=1 Tax=Actinomadura luteofluorescens TaxID=46163 RepID=UPI00363D5BA4